jgi:hypothetical protein
MEVSGHIHALAALPTHKERVVQLGDHELASGEWREGEVLFPL